MPHYTLYYFNGRGRAEICRMMFAVAGIAYDDRRLEFADWEDYKNGFPGWCVPALEMEDGYMMPETMAICRYLAREYDFYGGAHLEMMRCDYISDCLYEIMDDHMRYFHWQNGRFRNNTAGSELMSEDIECNDMRYPAYDHYMYWRYMNTCNRILPFLERTLQMCKNGTQYFMGEQMMWCDMLFYCCLETPFMDDPALFDNYPMLRALWSRVGHHPRIFNYLTRRPYSHW